MRILQLSPSMGRLCGVAVFADSMARELRSADVTVDTVPGVSGPIDADLLLVQYHAELVSGNELQVLLDQVDRPTVVMVHSTGLDSSLDGLSGTMAMTTGLVPAGSALVNLLFAHPAYARAAHGDRSAIRERLRLPTGCPIVATSGFLRFERQLPEIVSRLLPRATALGWGVLLVTSPWYVESPGLLEAIAEIGEQYPHSFWHRHEHLPEETLNDYLRASDLLWCWSRSSGVPYASGVVSQMYGSGTRIVAADKMQHEHVLRLPNVVRAPIDMDAFADEVLRQMATNNISTHDPAPVSWSRTARMIAAFFQHVLRIASGRDKIRQFTETRSER